MHLLRQVFIFQYFTICNIIIKYRYLNFVVLQFFARHTTGKQIEINRINPHLLDSYIDEFLYICDSCGLCYWSSKQIEEMMLNDKSQAQMKPSSETLVRND